MIPIAKLGPLDLPVCFSYLPYIQEKRNSVTRTVDAVIIQSSNPQIVHGDGTLPWTIDACKPPEFFSLYNLYNTPLPAAYDFHGYWGEVLEVLFTTLDKPKVKGRLFEVSGQFQVLRIIHDYTLECNP